jgi:polyisoprenoid-binding protein YceI
MTGSSQEQVAEQHEAREVRAPIDPARSRIGFRVRKMGLYFVKGRFTRAAGWVETGPEGDLRRAQLEIMAVSVNTRIPPRDWHLRSRDFFDVAHHPTIRVMVDAVDWSEEELRAVANFTIRGITRPVQLHGHVHRDGRGMALHLHTTLDRHEFGIRPRRPVDWIVGREVHVDALIALA